MLDEVHERVVSSFYKLTGGAACCGLCVAAGPAPTLRALAQVGHLAQQGMQQTHLFRSESSDDEWQWKPVSTFAIVDATGGSNRRHACCC